MSQFFVNVRKKYSKTVGETNEVDAMTTVALILQRVFGQQVLDPCWTWKKCYLHQILNLLLFVYVFFGTLQCLNTTENPELVVEACYTLIMIGIFPLKMLLFINKRFIFRKLYITAKTTLIEFIEADPSADINKVFKTGRNIVYTLYLIILVPISIYELTTLWNYINGRRILLSRSTTTLMPMTTPYYELAWFLHSLFLYEISTTVILDMWFVLLIYFLCVASDSLARVLNVEKKMLNESTLAYASRLNQGLRKFYLAHMEQVEYLNSLSSMYSWLAFVPLCNAAMCTCLIMLLMMSKDVNWRFAPHIMPMFAEIFAYNWFGEQIKTKATNINMALLNFDWRCLQLKHQKNYYILIAYTQKNFGIKTAIGMDLSLITMSAVLKVSYQAFTVLKTMDK